MIKGADNSFASIGRVPGVGPQPTPSGGAGKGGFADMLKASIDEVSRLQQDASRAVEDLASGKTEDVVGVMTAMEKADLAFKTLLAIRAKLMDAYEEVKQIQV